ncbi:hypothetical protein ALTER154_30011 [Alteromonas sp. 154]|nr:hypothetical protein ALTER154_30011 [Alteromonas sp. 154]
MYVKYITFLSIFLPTFASAFDPFVYSLIYHRCHSEISIKDTNLLVLS